ncbi:hypothetical protein OG426_53540 [Streptomyces canus]|uniref:hypothetical protein n=1 Tax=Streptomyces canus TaxID=58343 RepID=UPI00386CDBDA|nr:hypothetical protein OG426_53540 [Streptomyces canus]
MQNPLPLRHRSNVRPRQVKGEGIRLTIDTQTDTYEQAIAAVQAAYELNPRHRHEQLAAPPPRAIPGRARGSPVAGRGEAQVE